jgi:hypothetical protein
LWNRMVQGGTARWHLDISDVNPASSNSDVQSQQRAGKMHGTYHIVAIVLDRAIKAIDLLIFMVIQI